LVLLGFLVVLTPYLGPFREIVLCGGGIHFTLDF
jgi:hypothetical protein